MTDKDTRNEWEKHYGDILPKEEVDKAFTKVMNSADNLEKTQTKIIRTGLRHRIFRAAMTCAAAAVVLFFVPWATLKVNEKLNGQEAVLTAGPARLCEISTHNGETREVILPDSSKVLLNAGSVIIFPERFSAAERTVFLSGEAIFKVTHNQNIPFTVNTSDLAIRVHGTSFNVNAYPESGSTAATLCEGSVSATLNSSGESFLMVPNERLSYDRATGEATVTHVNAAEDTAWKRGDMCFRSENIHGIAKAIERKYGLNTYITSGKYDDMILTAKFVHGETLDQMLSAICKLVPGMRYHIENNCVYIR